MALGGCKSKKHKPTATELERGFKIPEPASSSAVDPSLCSLEGLSEPKASSARDSESDVESDRTSSLNIVQVVPTTHSSRLQPATKAKGKQRARALPDAEMDTHLQAEIDAHANPRYVSQMLAVFTEWYADQERARQVQEKVIEVRRDLEQCTRNTVEAYGWARVCCYSMLTSRLDLK